MTTVTIDPSQSRALNLGSASHPQQSYPQQGYQQQSTVAGKMRLTVRGRRVLAVLVALPLVAGLIALSMVFASGAGASVENGSADFRYLTVGHGDTLWALALEVAPNHDPREVVAEFKQLNALNVSAVQPGQQLAIPAQYSR